MSSTILPDLSQGKAGCWPPGMRGSSLAQRAQGQLRLTHIPFCLGPKTGMTGPLPHSTSLSW